MPESDLEIIMDDAQKGYREAIKYLENLKGELE